MALWPHLEWIALFGEGRKTTEWPDWSSFERHRSLWILGAQLMVTWTSHMAFIISVTLLLHTRKPHNDNENGGGNTVILFSSIVSDMKTSALSDHKLWSACACACACTCARTPCSHMHGNQNNIVELVLSYHVGLWDSNQVIRIGSKYLNWDILLALLFGFDGTVERTQGLVCAGWILFHQATYLASGLFFGREFCFVDQAGLT